MDRDLSQKVYVMTSFYSAGRQTQLFGFLPGVAAGEQPYRYARRAHNVVLQGSHGPHVNRIPSRR